VDKKNTRDAFRKSVFERDGYACVICGHKPVDPLQLDAHHITDRTLIPFGGYVAANGITLCTDRCNSINCHQKAEYFHAVGATFPGYTPFDLYDRIKSSYSIAYAKSLELGWGNSLSAIRQPDDVLHSIHLISLEEIITCVGLNESKASLETWELTCERLNEKDPLVIAYGKGRYVPDD